MLIFTQVKISEEGELKRMGHVYARREDITALWNCVDKYDCVVKGAIAIFVRGLGPMHVEANIVDVVDSINAP